MAVSTGVEPAFSTLTRARLHHFGFETMVEPSGVEPDSHALQACAESAGLAQVPKRYYLQDSYILM